MPVQKAQFANQSRAQAVDLTGDREFLTSETAEQALAAMLAPDSAVTKVINIAFAGG